MCITKSSAIDNLNTRLVKDAFGVLFFELTYMYNSCLQYVFCSPQEKITYGTAQGSILGLVQDSSSGCSSMSLYKTMQAGS